MRHKVAVVDDDRDVRETLQDALEQAGYEVLVAPSGLKLLAVLRVDRPELILLDVMMSWIDGLALCQALKHNDAYRDIPIVIISARTSAEDVRRGMEAGASDYLCKPFELNHLLQRVSDLIAHPHQNAAVSPHSPQDGGGGHR